MTKMFGSLTSDGLEESEDRIGGFQPLDTDIYTGPIKAAYAGASDGGAKNVTLIVDVGGREYRETIYITNKKGENFFLNKNDNSKKVPLPGFTVIDDLCLVTTGKPLAEQDVEEKVVNVYDRKVQREVPTSVNMLVELLGQTASFGIVRQTVNKNQKADDGSYVPTAETRDENIIEKIFHTETKMTVVEARNGAEGPTFWDSWLNKNQGQTRDKRTLKDGEGGQSGRPGRTPPAAGQSAPRKSLFGKAA